MNNNSNYNEENDSDRSNNNHNSKSKNNKSTTIGQITKITLKMCRDHVCNIINFLKR